MVGLGLKSAALRTVFRRTRILPPSPAFRPPKRGREAAGTREIAWGDKQSHVSRIHSGFDGRTRL